MFTAGNGVPCRQKVLWHFSQKKCTCSSSSISSSWLRQSSNFMLPSPSSSVCTRWFFLNRANVRESTDLSMVMIRVSSSRIDCGPSPSARAFTMTILLAVGPIPCCCSKSLHIFASIYIIMYNAKVQKYLQLQNNSIPLHQE